MPSYWVQWKQRKGKSIENATDCLFRRKRACNPISEPALPEASFCPRIPKLPCSTFIPFSLLWHWLREFATTLYVIHSMRPFTFTFYLATPFCGFVRFQGSQLVLISTLGPVAWQRSAFVLQNHKPGTPSLAFSVPLFDECLLRSPLCTVHAHPEWLLSADQSTWVDLSKPTRLR